MPRIDLREDEFSKIAGAVTVTAIDGNMRLKAEKDDSAIELIGGGSVSMESGKVGVTLDSAGHARIVCGDGGTVQLVSESEQKYAAAILQDGFLGLAAKGGPNPSIFKMADDGIKISFGPDGTGAMIELKADSITLKSGNTSLTIGANGISAKFAPTSLEMTAGGIKLEGGPGSTAEIGSQGVELKAAENSVKISPANLDIKAALIQIAADGINQSKGPIAGTKADGILQQGGAIVMIGQ